jgi:hypothetical protein
MIYVERDLRRAGFVITSVRKKKQDIKIAVLYKDII